MAKTMHGLLAGVMTTALLVGQTGAGFAADAGPWRIAQAQPGAEKRDAHPARPPLPAAAQPRPHAAPQSAPPAQPHSPPAAPRAAPSAAAKPLHQPVQSPPQPRAQPHAAPAPGAPPRAAQPAPHLQRQPSAAPAAPHQAPVQPRGASGAPTPPQTRPPLAAPSRPAAPQPPAPKAAEPRPTPPIPPVQPPIGKPMTPPAANGLRPQGGAVIPPASGQPPHPPATGAVQPLQPGGGAGTPGARPGPQPHQPPSGQPAQGSTPAPGQPPAGSAPRVPNAPPSQPRANSSGRIGPAGAAALGAAAGAIGGFLLTRPGAEPRSLEGVQRERREFRERDAQVYQEPGRTIVHDNGRYFLRHDENERFRALGGDIRQERRGDQFVTVYRGRDGDEVVTITDADGNLVRRYRRTRDGGEIVIIDNSYRGGRRAFADEVVDLPPPQLRIPRERYIVDAADADERLIYDTLTAPPIAPIPRRFTLDEIRSSPDVRAYTRSVDLDTVNFDTGSWTLAPDQVQKLGILAKALNQAIQRNANEVYLVEGHTDAVGSPVDNLSLSDRRAQAVAEILTRDFGVPPENLTTQGYGAQYPKVQTQGAERRNRRVIVRRITNLLSGQNQ